MATNTSILGLTKPTYAEDQDVTVLNSNFDLIDAEAGRLRANFAGTYSTSSAYAVGDYCIYQGNLYRCTTAISSSGEAWNASHWSQVSAGDELASANQAIAKQNVNDLGTKTVAEFESALLTLGNSLSEGGFAHFIVVLSNASGLFGAYTYIGFVEKVINHRLIVTVSRNATTVTIRGAYYGSWAWEQYALNSDVAELMKNSSSGGVDLGAYTSSSNKYTFPNDGYLMFNSGSVSSGKISVNIYTSNDKALFYYMNIATTYQVDMIFMKKGMKCYIDNKPAGTSVSFMPLDA